MEHKILHFGSDPELFLFIGDKPVSAIGLFPGSKTEPFMISEHESVQVDNVALEFNLKPSTNAKELFDSMQVCYDWSMEQLQHIDPRMGLGFVASAEFDRKELSHPDAKTFGCEPDWDAWTGNVRFFRKPKNRALRSCGGHLHLELSEPGFVDKNRLVRLLDKHVGTYCSDICGDDRRRLLYGKAGSFRDKSYGLEYRTPSNKWLSKIEYMEEVFRLATLAVEEYNYMMDAEESVRDYINNVQTIEQTI